MSMFSECDVGAKMFRQNGVHTPSCSSPVQTELNWVVKVLQTPVARKGLDSRTSCEVSFWIWLCQTNVKLTVAVWRQTVVVTFTFAG